MRRHWLPLLLVALHPAAALANVLDAEPFTLGAVVLIEGLILGAPAAWTLPDQQIEPPPEDPSVEYRIDGFRAQWPAHPGLGDEAFLAAIYVGAVAAAGAVAWLLLTFPFNRGYPADDPATLVLGSVLFALVVGILQAVATLPSRWVLNLGRRHAQIEVELLGRELTYGGRAWLLHDDDRYDLVDDGVVLERRNERMVIPASVGAASWLLSALAQARPDPDNGEVPSTLQALREDAERP